MLFKLFKRLIAALNLDEQRVIKILELPNIQIYHMKTDSVWFSWLLILTKNNHLKTGLS